MVHFATFVYKLPLKTIRVHLIRLYQVSHLSEVLWSTNIDNCKCKFVLIPFHKFDDSFVAVPMLNHNDFHQ